MQMNKTHGKMLLYAEVPVHKRTEIKQNFDI